MASSNDPWRRARNYREYLSARLAHLQRIGYTAAEARLIVKRAVEMIAANRRAWDRQNGELKPNRRQLDAAFTEALSDAPIFLPPRSASAAERAEEE